MLLFNLMLGAVLTAQVSSPIDLSKSLVSGKTYGAYCGIAGSHPPSRVHTENLIAKEDVATLSSWLTSPNLVIVTYAAEGLIRLQNKGVPLETDIVDKVMEVKKLQQYINTCQGCIYEELTIEECLKEFKFDLQGIE